MADVVRQEADSEAKRYAPPHFRIVCSLLFNRLTVQLPLGNRSPGAKTQVLLTSRRHLGNVAVDSREEDVCSLCFL